MLTDLLNATPTWGMALVVCAGVMAVTTAAQFILHRIWAFESRHKLNEVAGFLIAVVGVVYAVLLASIAILVLERHERAGVAVETEAGSVGDVYGSVGGLPADIATSVRALVTEYARTVTEDEWPEMERGVSPETGWQEPGWRQSKLMLELLSTFEPATESEKIMLTMALRQLDDLTDARRARIFTTDQGLGGLVWGVVTAGAIVTVGLALFFGLPSWRGHLLMVDMLALSVALVFVLMIAMDRPFVGGAGVSSEPFLRVMERMKASG